MAIGVGFGAITGLFLLSIFFFGLSSFRDFVWKKYFITIGEQQDQCELPTEKCTESTKDKIISRISRMSMNFV